MESRRLIPDLEELTQQVEVLPVGRQYNGIVTHGSCGEESVVAQHAQPRRTEASPRGNLGEDLAGYYPCGGRGIQ